MKTVAVIEENFLIRKGMAALLAGRMVDVQILEACGQDQLLQYADARDLQLIILGCSHTENEFNFFKALRKAFPAVPVVILGNKKQTSKTWISRHIVPYLKEGAMGYLSGLCGEAEFIKCIESVLRGQRYLDVELLYRLICFSKGNDNSQAVTVWPILTSHQYQVASCLAQGMPVGLIATRLGLRPSYISAVKKAVFLKLDIDNVAQLGRILDFGEISVPSGERTIGG